MADPIVGKTVRFPGGIGRVLRESLIPEHIEVELLSGPNTGATAIVRAASATNSSVLEELAATGQPPDARVPQFLTASYAGYHAAASSR